MKNTRSASLPSPPTPPAADLTHFKDMPLEVGRLRDSSLAGVANAEIFRCAVLAWCGSWHQQPAGSLPDDDDELCRLVGLGRDLRTWRKLRAGVLRGWRKFSDGRLYHPVVAEKVIGAWNSTCMHGWQRECDRIRKANKALKDSGKPMDALPEKPPVLLMVWPPDEAWKLGGLPDEEDGNSGGNPDSSGGSPKKFHPKIVRREEEKGMSLEPPQGALGDTTHSTTPSLNPARASPSGGSLLAGSAMASELAEKASERRRAMCANA